MLYIIAGLIALFIGYQMVEGRYGFDIFEWLLGAAMAVCAFVVLAFIVFLFAFLPSVDYKLAETKQIYALKDNSSLKGSFFLGSGYVDEEQKYFFIREEDGGKKMDTVDADQSVLYEGEKQTKIEKYEPVIKGKISRFLFTSSSPRDPKYKLYVPKNSITTDYTVDME